ncbi:MAG TPA: efflux RND transporter periplasmic adaptor subunit [Patescibacteria group bacterium]
MAKLKSIIKWFRKDKKRLIVLGVVLLVLFLVLRGRGKTAAPQYTTSQVEKGTIVASVTASGKVNTANVMEVTSGASGIIKKVYVKDGARVGAGQKLADITLDQSGQQKNAQAWSSYLASKNSLESAKTNLYTLQASSFAANQKFINDAVARDLATDDPTYIQENATWLAAQANYNNQQNVISQATSSVTSAWYSYQQTSPSVVAPSTGVFSNTGLVEGMIVGSDSSSASTGASTSTKLGIIKSAANPILSFNLAEIDVPKVKIGQKATITFDSIPDKTFTGKVVAVDKTGAISNNVTSYPAIIILDTTSDLILPNMSATASIIIETKSDILIAPTSAVQTQSGASTVRVLKNGQVENVEVTTGLSSDTQIEIVSGLQEGDEVVTGTVASTGTRTTSVFGGGFGGGATFRTTAPAGGGNAVIRRGN